GNRSRRPDGAADAGVGVAHRVVPPAPPDGHRNAAGDGPLPVDQSAPDLRSACGAARALVLAGDSRLIGADVRRGAAVRTGPRALLNRFNREVGPPGGL